MVSGVEVGRYKGLQRGCWRRELFPPAHCPRPGVLAHRNEETFRSRIGRDIPVIVHVVRVAGTLCDVGDPVDVSGRHTGTRTRILESLVEGSADGEWWGGEKRCAGQMTWDVRRAIVKEIFL